MRGLIVGYGNMGKAIEAALAAHGHEIAGRIDEGERPEDFLGGSPTGDFLEGEPPGVFLEGESGRGRAAGASGGAGARAVDVAFEFTTPASAEGLVVSLLSKHIPVVSGTTGWNTAPAARIAREQKIPFLHSPNFSIGVAVMRRLAASASALLSPFAGFEPGILERHHSAKKDAPSGTAKLLASAIESARPGPAVPVVALRQGGQPGEHLLFFEGESETLEIVHRARSRAIFASGAVAAAEWLLASGRRGPVTFDEFLDSISRRGTP